MASEIKTVHKALDKIIAEAAASGINIKHWKNSVAAGKGQVGMPDYTILVEGVLVAVECKYDMWIKYPDKMSASRSRRPTSAQATRLAEIDAAGGIPLVVDRHTVHQMKHLLVAVAEWSDMYPTWGYKSAARDMIEELWYLNCILPIREVNL